MIDSRAFREALRRIESSKPKLAPFFSASVEVAASLVTVDETVVQSLLQLTVVSERTYVDERTLVPVAVARRELSVLCGTLSDLSAVNPEAAQLLLSRYPSLSIPLDDIRADLVRLVSLSPGSGRNVRCHSWRPSWAAQVLSKPVACSRWNDVPGAGDSAVALAGAGIVGWEWAITKKEGIRPAQRFVPWKGARSCHADLRGS